MKEQTKQEVLEGLRKMITSNLTTGELKVFVSDEDEAKRLATLLSTHVKTDKNVSFKVCVL